MAIVVYPVDAVTGAPSYTGRSLRQTMSVFLPGATTANPFAVTSAIRRGTSPTTVTATSTTWTVGLHAGVLNLESAIESGPYAYSVNTAQTGAVTAAHATLPRVDIVWVRIDDPAESDGSSVPAVVAGYTAGTANASPVAPATPARCMVLAQLNVPASGGGAPTVVWKAPQLATPLDAAVTAQVTANVTGITTSDVVIATAASVAGDGVKKFRITTSFEQIVSVSGDIYIVKIKANGTQIKQGLFTCKASTATDSGAVITSHVPAAACVYTATATRFSGTGTGAVYASATSPIDLIVEQIA